MRRYMLLFLFVPLIAGHSEWLYAKASLIPSQDGSSVAIEFQSQSLPSVSYDKEPVGCVYIEDKFLTRLSPPEIATGAKVILAQDLLEMLKQVQHDRGSGVQNDRENAFRVSIFIDGICGVTDTALQISEASKFVFRDPLFDYIGEASTNEELLQFVSRRVIELRGIRSKIVAEQAQWTADLNPVFMLSDEERQQLLRGLIIPPDIEIEEEGYYKALPPASLDWRSKDGYNWMTPIRNQGSCGSCWAFAAVGQVEPLVNIAEYNWNIDLDLAEQTLVTDCCSGCGDCDGGWHYLALDYIKNTGIPLQTCDPYTATSGPCDRCATWLSQARKITSYNQVTGASQDATAIKNALQYHPLSTTVYADATFQAYSGGIYSYSGPAYSINHAIVFAGWDDSQNYWIIKNSWGSGWGESGYMRATRGQNNRLGWYTYNAEYTPLFVDAGPDTIITQGESLTLNPTVSGGAPNYANSPPTYTYLWAPSTGLSDSAIKNPVATPAVTTTYKLTASDLNVSKSDSLTITVLVASGPYVKYLKHLIDDGLGNNDGTVNPGETIRLPLWVKNFGTDTAYNVTGKLRETDAYITITDSSKSFGTIAASDSAQTPTPYVFNVSTSTPGSHPVTFNLVCKDQYDSTWTSSFSILVLRLPDIKVTPDSLGVIVQPDDTTSQLLNISNIGTDTLRFYIVESGTAKGSGGPDAAGYKWIDSDASGGPTYSWIEISGTGTQITGLGDDKNVGPFPIGFYFPFYDSMFTTFRFCTNGWISFTHTTTEDPGGYYWSGPLPNTDSRAPRNLLAALWDDLDFSASGTAWYKSDGDKLVVQFNNVPQYGGGGPYTFEIILYSDGTILYQYKSIGSPNNENTIGFQNKDGTIGLQIARNQVYVHNNMAIKIARGVDWLYEKPAASLISIGGGKNITVSYDAGGLTPDTTYKAWLKINSNDQDESIVSIPVTLTITTSQGDVGPTAITSPTDTVLFDSIYTPTAEVSNFTGDTAKDFNVTCKIDTGGYSVYTDTKFISSLTPYDTVVVNFTNWTPQNPGKDYGVTVFTQLAGDTVLGNDTSSITVHEASIKGDVVRDFEVNILDVTRTQQIILGKGDIPTTYELWAADVVEDGEINILDIIAIINIIQGGKKVTHITQHTSHSSQLSALSSQLSSLISRLSSITSLQDTAIVLIPDAYGIIGTDSNIVPVNLDNSIPVVGVQLRVVYDTVLTAHEADTTSRSAMMNVIDSEVDTGAIQVLLFSTALDSILPGTGAILAIPFYVSLSGTAGDSVLLHIDKLILSDKDANEIPALTVDGWFHIQAIGIQEVPLPTVYKLSQAYPTPGMRRLTIPYQLPEPTRISIKVYDATGKLVKTLLNEKRPRGFHFVIWDTENIPNGIYFYRLDTHNFTDSKKLIILR